MKKITVYDVDYSLAARADEFMAELTVHTNDPLDVAVFTEDDVPPDSLDRAMVQALHNGRDTTDNMRQVVSYDPAGLGNGLYVVWPDFLIDGKEPPRNYRNSTYAIELSGFSDDEIKEISLPDVIPMYDLAPQIDTITWRGPALPAKARVTQASLLDRLADRLAR